MKTPIFITMTVGGHPGVGVVNAIALDYADRPGPVVDGKTVLGMSLD
jgi:hypothetical protein